MTNRHIAKVLYENVGERSLFMKRGLGVIKEDVAAIQVAVNRLVMPVSGCYDNVVNDGAF